MDKIIKKECLKRINYVVGHLRGIKMMIEENRYCVDIIQQNLGVIAALKKINEKLLDNHLKTCLVKAIKKNSKAKNKALKEILDIYKIVK